MGVPPSCRGWKIALGLLLMPGALSSEAPLAAQDQPPGLPELPFHLTARPWAPLNVSGDTYLRALEGVCRFTAGHQASNGAVIDPFLKGEHQYATPYFAFGVGTLIHAGKAPDLLDNGVRAMDHATECFAKGRKGIPDEHAEFFDACLPGAVTLYEGHVPAETIALWKDRLRTPREKLLADTTNNWRAYAMKGEWLRAQLGLVDPGQARDYIENSWLHAQQRDRILPDKWNLYEDRLTDPDSLAVEAVGRGNLLALVAAGYDGPSAGEIKACVERGTATTLFLQDPSGQCPPNGRTDDHVFNDVLYQLGFDVMAGQAWQAGDARRAGQYRHAAMLSFDSIARWQRTDPPWAGSYYITKNHFDPALRVGYQPASNYTNYNGAIMLHLAESYLARKTDIPEQPAPVEIGGYAFTTDDRFASAVANAGGMQLFAALRGDTKKAFDRYWTPLGVLRFGRIGWDSRLGPSDGGRNATGAGVSFAPTWLENGHWVHMADVPDRYSGKFSLQFAHPLLVRCAIDYAPIQGPGPTFRHEFVITPDGVLATLRSTDARDFGVTWPLLEDDGNPLHPHITSTLATTAYSDQTDQQCFLSLDTAPAIDGTEERLQSTYGWLRPVRALAANGINQTFVYPRSPADPPAEDVQKGFHLTSDGFTSPVGSVHGNLYVGRTSAGGEGSSIDCTGNGKPDAVFVSTCRFILQLQQGKITSVEADRDNSVQIYGQQIALKAYVPVTVGAH